MGFRSLLLASFLFSGAAFAQDQQTTSSEATMAYSNSQYLHQAPGGKFEVTPTLEVEAHTVEIKNSPEEIRSSDVFARVKGEYGFGDMFSLSAQLGIGSGRKTDNDCPGSVTCDPDAKRSGLVNPIISANFRFPIGLSAIRAGLDYAFATDDGNIGQYGTKNYSTGGSTLSPYLGYEITFGRNILGARVSYDVLSTERTYKTTSGKTKEKKGEYTKAALFYEFNFPKIASLGVALEHMHVADTENNSTGSFQKQDNSYDKNGVNIYVPLKFNEMITLIPSLAAGGYKHDGQNTIDTHSYADLRVDGRFTF